MNETAQVALAVTIIMLVFNFVGPIINKVINSKMGTSHIKSSVESGCKAHEWSEDLDVMSNILNRQTALLEKQSENQIENSAVLRELVAILRDRRIR